MLPGLVAVSSTCNASSMTTRCWSGLFGSPSGRPKGKRTWATRGGWSFSATPLCIITITVGIPAASIARAISPPDRLHTGQVEEISTASTPSSFRRPATSGAVSSSSLSHGRMKPMKE